MKPRTQKALKFDRLTLTEEGIDPKSGDKMKLYQLTGARIPQMVYFNPETRTCLPMAEPVLLNK